MKQAKKLGFNSLMKKMKFTANMEQQLWQKIHLLNLLTTEILEWNHYVLENFINL